MKKCIKEVLDKIESLNFETFIVGGYVRDYLLHHNSYDVDICTNAKPNELKEIFPKANITIYGVKFLKDKYNFEITTYRKELVYQNRRPIKFVFVNSLSEDLERRDFTINALCMDKDKNIIDLVDGLNDLQNQIIKMIGNISFKLQEDPLRILRAIRLSTTLNFNIDSNLYKEIKKNKDLVYKLSKTRIREELDKILLSTNFKKGLKLLNDLEIFALNYDNIVYVNNLIGMYAQINLDKYLQFTNEENRNIIIIRQIIKNHKIDNKILFKYDKNIWNIVSQILNIDMAKKYNDLPIKDVKDLAITSEEVMHILNIKPSKKVKNMQEEIINLILENKLNNNYEDIKKYLLERK